MITQLEKEIKEEIKKTDYQEFLNYLGINYEDFEQITDDIDFDDYSA